jgi:hypothetical protein
MALTDEDKSWIAAQIDKKVAEITTALFERLRDTDGPEAPGLRRRAALLELERVEAEFEAVRPHLKFGQLPANRI